MESPVICPVHSDAVCSQGRSHRGGHTGQTDADAGQEDGDVGRVSLPDPG